METREKVILQGDSLYLSLPKVISDLKVREEEKENLLIYLAQDIYQWIDSLVNADPAKDVVGVLLGQVYQGEDGSCIVIDEAMEARYTQENQSKFCFTHETWEDIYALKESKYPDKKILGWFRTYSGLGMNLSNYDLLVQKGFFKNPWQVVYILDPKQKQKGFFRWKGKEIISCPFFNLYTEKVPLAEASETREKELKKTNRRKGKKSSSGKLLARRLTLIAVLLGLVGWATFSLVRFANFNLVPLFSSFQGLVQQVDLLGGFLQDALEAIAKR